ncbi:MAG: antitoxin [Thermodesulfobacteriota bacterium]|nr:antitoxin [Thermodesulfobacteriota bacterium]
MKTITVRGIDSVLSEKMKQAAKQEGKSVNQVVIDTIRQHFGMIKEKKFTVAYHDLDHIFGRWSQEEFDKIQGKIDTERKIDKEL